MTCPKLCERLYHPKPNSSRTELKTKYLINIFYTYLWTMINKQIWNKKIRKGGNNGCLQISTIANINKTQIRKKIYNKKPICRIQRYCFHQYWGQSNLEYIGQCNPLNITCIPHYYPGAICTNMY